MKTKKHIDRFILLMSSFAIILLSLWGYLRSIDNDIKHYNSYQYNIQRLAILDYQIENFFLEIYSYVDYSNITDITQKFESIMTSFKSSPIKDEFGEDIYNDIIEIDKLFQNKQILVENFKSINSRLTNSIHYLYDLRKTIMKKEKDNQIKDLVSTIFFQIGQISMNIQIDTNIILSNLEDLELVAKGKYYKYFYNQIYIFIKDSTLLEEKLNQNSQIKLIKLIEKVNNNLLKRYNNNLYKEKIITFTFFILAFIILFLLLLNYKKVLKNSRELLAFRYAVENSDNIVLMTNKDRVIEYVNDAFENITGYSKEEVIGQKPNILKSDLMPVEIYQNMNKLLDNGQKWQGELINKSKDGSILYEQASIVPIVLEQETVGFLAIKLDITDYIEQQNRLKQSAIVFESTKDGILILDTNYKVISINNSLINMSGYNKYELLNNSISMLSSRLKNRLNIDKLWNAKTYIEKKDGTKLPVWLSITDVYDDNGKLINFIAIYTDLSEIIRTQKQADFLQYHDSLTLLPNRKNFERDIDNIFKEYIKDREHLSIMFFGLDRFKSINDSLGSSVGDNLLISVSKKLQSMLPKDTYLARWHGDKFIALLEVDKQESGELAEEILKNISKPILIGKHRLSITMSIGISIYLDNITDADTLIKNADIAMNSAKDKGKNRFEYYEQQTYINIQSRLNIEQELKYAIEKNELVLNYQPQYNINNKQVVAVESLIRWHSKKLGVVSPVDFIYIAEDTGLIIDIGYYIFREACQAYMRWVKQGIELELIAINVSSIQFREDGFFNKIKNIIQEVGIPPSSVEIELTESYILEPSNSNLAVLNSFRKLGCKISIDDFGTGYSSMSYLKELPIDTLKIDQSFISDLSHNKYDKTVSKAIIALAHGLDYRVIAEGIETQEQEDLLKEYQCDVGQGYLISKPLEESKFIEFILSHNKKV